MFPEGLWDDARAQASSASYRSCMDDLMVDWNGGRRRKNVKRIAAREGMPLADARQVILLSTAGAPSLRDLRKWPQCFSICHSLGRPLQVLFLSYYLLLRAKCRKCRALNAIKSLRVLVPFNPFSVFLFLTTSVKWRCGHGAVGVAMPGRRRIPCAICSKRDAAGSRRQDCLMM